MYSKLLVGIGSLIIFIVAVLVFIGSQAVEAIQYKNFSAKAGYLSQTWFHIELSAYDLLGSPSPITELQTTWKTAIDDFENALASMKDDPSGKKLGAIVLSQIENASSLWDFTKSNLSTTNEALSTFISEVVEKKPAIGRGYANGLEGELSSMGKLGLVNAQDIEYFNLLKAEVRNVTIASNAFKINLHDMEKTIDGRVEGIIRRTSLVSAALILFSIIGAFLYVHIFARRLSARIRSIEDALKTMADRDFTGKMVQLGRDEIGMLSIHLGTVVSSLGDFFATVREAASKVISLKEELSAGTSQSAAAVNEINQNIESIKNRFSLLDSAIGQATEALVDIGNYLQSFKNEALTQTDSMQKAGHDLDEAIASIASLSQEIYERNQRSDALKRSVMEGGERVQGTNDIIKTIAHDIEGIVEIIDLIDQISEQTNILSMNAAIESAHAGLAGKGFAVVADEIRKLAESTQDNALRIGEALTAITDKISTALSSSDASARALDSIGEEFGSFIKALENIEAKASHSSQESVQVGAAIKNSIDATARISESTADMYDRHRAIQDAMENIRSISDETLSGITEIDLGSQEILESVVNVEQISNQSRDAASELENALSGFKTVALPECEDSGDTYDERGVAIKSPPTVVKRK